MARASAGPAVSKYGPVLISLQASAAASAAPGGGRTNSRRRTGASESVLRTRRPIRERSEREVPDTRAARPIDRPGPLQRGPGRRRDTSDCARIDTGRAPPDAAVDRTALAF